ncbi:MAG: NAD(P)-binding domain-containing protein [Acidimicrobiia bacterium]|nr:NAD(P)/FAD-dependent oxidoreductase [Acidimicrobiia bacterium]NNF09454.1 NAD(P)-binding domain-containing protein [Acidimicrobiia bacterium]NNL71678.1 NAD(P)-binding domain-containing protein [Acidimicrobiia bacterium]
MKKGRLVDNTDYTFDTIVVGGGQAGLIVGHALREQGVDFTILDASARVGDAWRHRWDSLRLFTQAFMNGLPGMAFPAPPNAFVGKEDVADFLETYAKEMELPVRSGVRVERLTSDGDGFRLDTTGGTFSAHNVIVAMADYQKPYVPDFAAELDPSIVQMHTVDYRNPSQLPDGPALVVGLGNSGADIAVDVAGARDTIVAGHESGAVPFRLESWFGRHLGTRLVRFGMVKVLNTSTPIGRRARPKLMAKGPPLVRVRPKELKRAGVRRVGRIEGVRDGKPVTAEDEVLEVSSIVWCTGYRPGFDWIDLPIFDEHGAPQHTRGVIENVPGLYFVGLFFLHAVWSETITGVQPDVEYTVRHLMEHRSRQPA